MGISDSGAVLRPRGERARRGGAGEDEHERPHEPRDGPASHGPSIGEPDETHMRVRATSREDVYLDVKIVDV